MQLAVLVPTTVQGTGTVAGSCRVMIFVFAFTAASLFRSPSSFSHGASAESCTGTTSVVCTWYEAFGTCLTRVPGTWYESLRYKYRCSRHLKLLVVSTIHDTRYHKRVPVRVLVPCTGTCTCTPHLVLIPVVKRRKLFTQKFEKRHVIMKSNQSAGLHKM